MLHRISYDDFQKDANKQYRVRPKSQEQSEDEVETMRFIEPVDEETGRDKASVNKFSI